MSIFDILLTHSRPERKNRLIDVLLFISFEVRQYYICLYVFYIYIRLSYNIYTRLYNIFIYIYTIYLYNIHLYIIYLYTFTFDDQ